VLIHLDTFPALGSATPGRMPGDQGFNRRVRTRFLQTPSGVERT
jgi:hypothetical protein